MAEGDPRHARILRAALDLPTAERDGYVMRECAGDAALLARLRALLALDAETALPLDRPAEAHAAQMMADEHDAGGRIGPFGGAHIRVRSPLTPRRSAASSRCRAERYGRRRG